MKVGELIKALNKIDPNLDVLCYAEDVQLPPAEGRASLFLEIIGIDASEGERCRIDEVPYMKFGKSDHSEKIAFIEVTPDF